MAFIHKLTETLFLGAAAAQLQHRHQNLKSGLFGDDMAEPRIIIRVLVLPACCKMRESAADAILQCQLSYGNSKFSDS